jgi:hypothetical protein
MLVNGVKQEQGFAIWARDNTRRSHARGIADRLCRAHDANDAAAQQPRD